MKENKLYNPTQRDTKPYHEGSKSDIRLSKDPTKRAVKTKQQHNNNNTTTTTQTKTNTNSTTTVTLIDT